MNHNNYSTPHNELKLESPPGDLAIWIFILAELSVFGLLFVVYAFTRRHNLELFNLYQLQRNKVRILDQQQNGKILPRLKALRRITQDFRLATVIAAEREVAKTVVDLRVKRNCGK